MKYRRLGGTELEVSVICLGPMRAAAKTAGDDEISRRGEYAMRAALDAGVNFIHSSYEYGTRWMMSRVLRDHPLRHELHHVIKVPVPDFKDGDRFDPSKFRLRIEEALRDLHTERISVLQWMWRSDPNTDERRLPLLDKVLGDVWGIFERLKEEGKVQYLMTFPYTVACGRAAMETGKFAGLIAFYNLVETEMVDLFGELESRDMGFIGIRPLYEGILTDQRVNRKSLPENDRFREERYVSEYAKVERLVEIFGEEIGRSMTSFAIRFALAHPLVASVIVGLNNPGQVEGIITAANDELPSAQIVNKARELWRSRFD